MSSAQSLKHAIRFLCAPTCAHRATFPSIALLVFVLLANSLAHTQGQWTSTSSMLQARASHTATLLNNGKVLIAGGSFSVACKSVCGIEP